MAHLLRRPGYPPAAPLPATALGCVNRVITDLGIFDVGGDCFVCVARAEGVVREQIVAATGAPVLFTTATSGR